MSDHEFVEGDGAKGEPWAVCGACGRFRDRHHADGDLVVENERLRSALQRIANVGSQGRSRSPEADIAAEALREPAP